MLRIKNQQNFGAAVMFILFGMAGLWFGREYAVGTASHMGPGYIPRALSWGLILFGLVVGLRAVRWRSAGPDGPRIERIGLRTNLLILAAIVSFAFLIRSTGLAVTTFAVALLSALASTESRWRETIPLAALLAILCVLIFIYGLRQSMPVFGSS